MSENDNIKNIIQNNLGLITKLCTFYYRKNPKHLLDLEDYYQEAFTIVTEIAKRHDPEKGKMSTFLYHAIKNGLTNLANQNNSSLSVTNEAVYLATNIYSLKSQGLSNSQICQQLNINQSRLKECENIISSGSNNFENITEIPTFSDLFQDIESYLSKDEIVILNYYIAGLSTKEISSMIKKSPAVVRNKMRVILNKIKKYYHE
jgi:RNA polymerase sigma factor (sigma-70 family)